MNRSWNGRARSTGSSLGLLAASLCGILALPGIARAQVITSETARHGSPQHFALEFRFSPYKPDIDSEFGRPDRHPYQDFFGSGRHLLSQIEFDYQFLRHVGSLGVGASVGYFKQSGHNLLADGSAAVSADDSTLRLLPFSVSLVYRFDLAYERLNIPLVPYGKLGFDYILWTINNGNGEVPSSQGGRGQGGTLGWHATAGVSLALDFFDQHAANQFDEDLGVNHTHLFFEYGHIAVNGLGQANRLHVGDDTWTAGLLFEF